MGTPGKLLWSHLNPTLLSGQPPQSVPIFCSNSVFPHVFHVCANLPQQLERFLSTRPTPYPPSPLPRTIGQRDSQEIKEGQKDSLMSLEIIPSKDKILGICL